jgi:hypothetical protein
MKNIFYIILSFQFLNFEMANAQMDLPNPGFEEWDSIPGIRPFWEPKNYNSKCGAFQTTNRIYVFRSNESHSGNYSLLLTPAIDSMQISYPDYNSWIQLDTIKNRPVSLSTQPFEFTLPLIGIPKKISGWYKYIPDSTAFITSQIFLPYLILHTGVSDIGSQAFCGRAGVLFFEPKAEFTKFSAMVEDECPPFTPTFYSLIINFPSKNKLMNPAGKLWLDDLEIEYEPTSVADKKKNSFAVFPNPGSHTLQISGLAGHEKISIQNSQGKTVIEKEAQEEMPVQIETSGLPKGMYFILVEKNGGKEVQKWVKQ